MEATPADKEIVNSLVAEAKKAAAELREHPERYKELKSALDAYRAENEELKTAVADLQHKSHFVGATPRLVDSAEFKSFGSFARKGGVMATNDNVTGGFLCVNEVSSEIMRLAEDDNVIRQLANKMSCNGGSIDIPVEDNSDAVEWIGETEDKPSAPVKFSNVHINIFDINREVPVTLQLIDDAAFGVESFIFEHIGRRIASVEENSFLNGKGPKTVEGILGCDRIGSVTSGTAGKITYDDLIDATVCNSSIAKSSVKKKAVYIMSPSAAQMLRKQKATDGHYILPPLAQGLPPTLDGTPVYVSTYMPAVASGAASVLYGDMSGYTIIDRRDITIQRNPYKVGGQVIFEFWKRVGAAVTDGGKLAKVVVQ